MHFEIISNKIARQGFTGVAENGSPVWVSQQGLPFTHGLGVGSKEPPVFNSRSPLFLLEMHALTAVRGTLADRSKGNPWET